MLDAPGGLWLVIFIVSYEIGKALVNRFWRPFWRRRASNTGTEPSDG